MEKEEIENWKKAGEKTAEVLSFAKNIIKAETPLLEIAEQIEEYVQKHKLAFAFPINLSKNEIAAHYSPFHNDKETAGGLMKLDIGICINGFIGDAAISIDLTPEQKHKDLIEASSSALKAAIKAIKHGVEIREAGKVIFSEITTRDFSPIRNLSGHELKQWNLHAGITIPNYDNGNKNKLKEGIYAIEPFATLGTGIVQESKPSGIFMLKQKKPTRNKEILSFIGQEYKTLPFSSRWLIKKFGLRCLFSLSQLEKEGILHQFPILVEKSHKAVSQAEHTLAVLANETIVLTKED